MDAFAEQVLSLKSKAPKKPEGQTSFWRTEEPIFDEDGSILVGGMWPAQREWWNLPNKVKLLLGGYGAGKTISASKRAIASALYNAPAPVAVISPTFAMAVDTMIVTITELLEGKRTLMPQLSYVYNTNRHRFTIYLGNRKASIIVYSGDNPQRLKGPNLAAAYIDEPFIQPEEVFLQMLARIRHPEARLREIGLTGTPEGVVGYGRELVEGELHDKHDVGFVRASTRQNLALDPDYVQTLERAYDEKTAQAYIEGYFVNLSEGRMYYAFTRDHNIQALGIPDDVDFIGAAGDFNVDPMASCVFWVRGSHMHVFKEYELPNSDTEKMYQLLAQEWWERGLREVYPDPAGRQRSTSAPAGRSDFDIIRRLGFTVKARPSHTPRRDRFNAVNGKLRARGGISSLTIEPKSADGVLGCPKLINYLDDLTHENSTKRGAGGGLKMTHLTDAMSYGVDYLFPVGRSEFTVKPLVGF